MAGRLTTKKLAARVTPHLPAGEQYVASFQAEVGHDPRLRFRYRIVVKTDVALHLYKAKWWPAGTPGELLETFPEGTTIRRHRRHLLHDEIFLGEHRLSITNAWSRQLTQVIEALEFS